MIHLAVPDASWRNTAPEALLQWEYEHHSRPKKEKESEFIFISTGIVDLLTYIQVFSQ